MRHAPRHTPTAYCATLPTDSLVRFEPHMKRRGGRARQRQPGASLRSIPAERARGLQEPRARRVVHLRCFARGVARAPAARHAAMPPGCALTRSQTGKWVPHVAPLHVPSSAPTARLLRTEWSLSRLPSLPQGEPLMSELAPHMDAIRRRQGAARASRIARVRHLPTDRLPDSMNMIFDGPCPKHGKTCLVGASEQAKAHWKGGLTSTLLQLRTAVWFSCLSVYIR
jgi:hypothetical protein